MLQTDSQQQSMLYLQVIAAQLTNGTVLPLSDTSSTPTSSTIRVNTLWFAGLVLSLVAALLGIFAKQWLREYTGARLASPRDAVRVRQFRHAGLLAWRVGDILALLPLLIQASLVLFLAGLLDLLWATAVNQVAAVSTAIVAVSFALVMLSLVLPLAYPACPYKSPLTLLLRAFGLGLRDAAVGAWAIVSRQSGYRSLGPPKNDWWAADVDALAVQPEPALRALEYTALRWAWSTLRDDGFQAALVPCLAELTPRRRLQFVLDELTRHAGCPQAVLLEHLRRGPQGATDALYRGLLRAGHSANARLLDMVLDVLPDAGKVAVAVDEEVSALMAGTPVRALSRLDLLHAVHPLLNAYTLTGSRQYVTREAATRRAFAVLLDVLDYQGQPYATVGAVFELFSAFSHLFWHFVTVDSELPALGSPACQADAHTAVVRMLRATTRNLAPGVAEHPTVASFPLHVVHPYESALLTASGAILHYLFAVSLASLCTPALATGLPELLRAMEIHVRSCTRARRPYRLAPGAGTNVRVNWTWSLRRLAQSDPRACVGLLAALTEHAREGQAPSAERGPLEALVAVVRRAGLGVRVLSPALGGPWADDPTG
jgi:hypothetical protein